MSSFSTRSNNDSRHISEHASSGLSDDVSMATQQENRDGEEETNCGDGKSEGPTYVGLNINNTGESYKQSNGERKGRMPPAPIDNRPRPANRTRSCQRCGCGQWFESSALQ